jgi:hypothetical protein
MAITVHPAHANILSNASFEGGDRGTFGAIWFPGWSTQGNNGAVTREFCYPYGLGNSVKLWYNDTVLFQGLSVVAGQSYSVGGFAYSGSYDNGGVSGWDSICKIEWYQGNIWTGTKISEEEIGRFNGQQDALDSWKQVGRAVTAPALAESAKLLILMAENGNTLKKGSIGWDSFDVETIPEPASLLLLSAGVIICVRGQKGI